MYFDSYATGKRIQHLRKANGMTQEEMAIKLNISDRHLGKIERGEGTASIDLLVEVAVLLKTTLDFLIIGVTETPRERELTAHIKKQNKMLKVKCSLLNDKFFFFHLSVQKGAFHFRSAFFFYSFARKNAQISSHTSFWKKWRSA